MNHKRRGIFFVLFAFSGFCGLIYESIWSQYLKLFLGHAAYAQTLVLAIFMGGMSIGSVISSRYSPGWRRLLLGYAIAEGAIGVAAIVFHPLFTTFIDFSYAIIIPKLGLPLAITTYKWVASGLLILPQSILLGMTFPLMTAALLRTESDESGSVIGSLYFANSIGAVIGVLTSGFVLVPGLGLPGTICFAGVVNIALAAVVAMLVKGDQGRADVPVADSTVTAAAASPRLLLLASFLTGAASFIYEIGWIRMLCLVLGSSTHAFELMLSAFILGLACGGLWIKRRIDSIGNTVKYLAMVQIFMGLLALATLPLYGNTFEIMRWLIGILPKSGTGYFLFNLSSHAIASAIMLPATFCAGMTLPLITYTLLKGGYGERSIGEVYGANTLGAILGVFFAIHVGLPVFGLKGLLILGAGLDLAVGLFLVLSREAFVQGTHRLGIAGCCVMAVLAVLLFVQLDPYKMASGVYRHGELLNPGNGRIVSHEDGKTATVSLTVRDGVLSIRTNGKSDAAVCMVSDREPTPDEATMVLLGAIPLMANPGATTAANIGLGSGITSHTLLSSTRLRQVDTIEIERKMVTAARQFGPHSRLAFTDPRSHIFIDDAKTYFSSHNKKYDIIVAEPSNPWVSGVASLFTSEFYHLVKNHMNDDGIFVQWLQLYEINGRIAASVFKALNESFSDYAAYFTNDTDLLVICKKKGIIGPLNAEVLQQPTLAATLKRLNINGVQGVEIRRIGNRKMLAPFMDSFPIRANSDYYPVVDQEASRSRFMGENAAELEYLSREALPLVNFLAPGGQGWQRTEVVPTSFFTRTMYAYHATAMRDFLLTGAAKNANGELAAESVPEAFLLRSLFYGCANIPEKERRAVLFAGGKLLFPYLAPSELAEIWQTLEQGRCAGKLSGLERAYVAFFKALSVKDSVGTKRTAAFLLANESDITPDRRSFLVAASMLACIDLGERTQARQLWEKYLQAIVGNDQPSLLFRLLVAQSGARP